MRGPGSLGSYTCTALPITHDAVGCGKAGASMQLPDGATVPGSCTTGAPISAAR